MGACWEWYLPPGNDIPGPITCTASPWGTWHLGTIHLCGWRKKTGENVDRREKHSERESEYAHLLSKRILDETAAMESAELYWFEAC